MSAFRQGRSELHIVLILLKLIHNSLRETKGNHYREGGLDV